MLWEKINTSIALLLRNDSWLFVSWSLMGLGEVTGVELSLQCHVYQEVFSKY